MLTVNAASGFGSVVGETYQANAVHFDGTNDYLTRGADLTGNADTQTLMGSFWINFKGGDGSEQYIYNAQGTNSGGLWITKTTGNKISIQAKAYTGAAMCNLVSGSTFVASGGWNHILWDWYGASSGRGNIYVNDSDDSAAFTNNNASLVQMVQANHSVGSDTSGNGKLYADIADFVIYWTTSDIATESNRRPFISGAGKPVDLGSDGSKGPTTPKVFFTGETASWYTNAGAGGGFTENGALTDGTDSPSD